MPSTSTPSLAKGFLAGLVAGAIGTAVLNLFQKLSLEGTRLAEEELGSGNLVTAQQQQLLKSFDHAHAETAQTLATAAGAPLSREAQAASVPVVEYAFGALCGGFYGALAEFVPSATAGFGTVYGSVLFTGASELVLPSIGFVPAPSDRTPIQHAGGLAGNMVYGAATEAIRRLLRR